MAWLGPYLHNFLNDVMENRRYEQTHDNGNVNDEDSISANIVRILFDLRIIANGSRLVNDKTDGS